MRHGSEAQDERDTAEKLVHVRWGASAVLPLHGCVRKRGGGGGASLATAVRTHTLTHTTTTNNTTTTTTNNNNNPLAPAHALCPHYAPRVARCVTPGTSAEEGEGRKMADFDRDSTPPAGSPRPRPLRSTSPRSNKWRRCGPTTRATSRTWRRYAPLLLLLPLLCAGWGESSHFYHHFSCENFSGSCKSHLDPFSPKMLGNLPLPVWTAGSYCGGTTLPAFSTGGTVVQVM